MIKEIKDFIFYLTIIFIVILSALIIHNLFKTQKYFTETSSYDFQAEINSYKDDEVYEENISSARTKLQNLRNNLNNGVSYSGECLDNIEDVIDYSYKFNHPVGENRKELINYWVELTAETENRMAFLNYSHIRSTCFTEENTATDFKNDISMLMGKNRDYYDMKINSYRNQFFLDGNINNLASDLYKYVAVSDVETLHNLDRSSINMEIKDTQTEYINDILDYLGGTYEK